MLINSGTKMPSILCEFLGYMKTINTTAFWDVFPWSWKSMYRQVRETQMIMEAAGSL